jgi:hypothetical protein
MKLPISLCVMLMLFGLLVTWMGYAQYQAVPVDGTVATMTIVRLVAGSAMTLLGVAGFLKITKTP